jgi:GNAT superfamily N-acetyltransferase
MTDLRYMELTRELVTPRHVDDINRLLPQLSSGARPCTEEWLNYVFDNNTRLFVAVDGDRLVGTVLLVPMVILVGQKDWIEDVVVDEDYRQRGIVSVLMDMAEQASRERSAKSINLTSSAHRGSARRVYGKRGYEVRDTDVFRLTL